MAAAPAPLPAAVAGWWEYMNGSPACQDGIFYALAVLYGLVAATSFKNKSSSTRVTDANDQNVPCRSKLQEQHRVPEYGWTTQKVFQFLNFVVTGARCSIFAFRRQVQQVKPLVWMP
ncbi:hypothetical protein QOZ80_2AG0141090 [Eleusine coracana subsp. coracana]|nr:hypothetical protein QOZ80_2AG0141090 [Eleusine coracana subsp. coracana]